MSKLPVNIFERRYNIGEFFTVEGDIAHPIEIARRVDIELATLLSGLKLDFCRTKNVARTKKDMQALRRYYRGDQYFVTTNIAEQLVVGFLPMTSTGFSCELPHEFAKLIIKDMGIPDVA